MSIICSDDVQYVRASFCSSGGRLFEWRNGLYRGIAPEFSPFYGQLFQDGVIDRLVAQGFLVETHKTDMRLEGFGLVVSHRKLPFVSYPYEWCSEAFKDAALLFLDLNLELLKAGLLSFDVSPYNIVFDGSKPLYVDLESIRRWEMVSLGAWFEEFQQLFLRPLRLLEAGNERIARLCLSEWKGWRRGVSRDDFARLTDQELGRRFFRAQRQRMARHLPDRLKRPLRRVRQTLQNRFRPPTAPQSPTIQQLASELQALRAQVSALDMVRIPNWDYYRDLFTFPSFTDRSEWSSKQHGVARALHMTSPGSIIDIGSNRGWYAQYAASLGASVIALDRDDNLVSLLYRDSKQNELPLQPLVMDIVWPTPTQGLLGMWTGAADRLKCDMVLTLALIHHLVHSQGMHFEQIVDGLSQFTTRWLLIEFVPYEDPNLADWRGLRRQDWYNLANFLAVLRTGYNVVKVTESDPPQRTIILAEKLALPK